MDTDTSEEMKHRDHFEEEVLRLLREDHCKIEAIERLLKTPHLTAFQTGNPMAIGNITAGQTGQFAVEINFPSGVTGPAGYAPTITWSSPDSLITFTPATTDLTSGAVPLSQQIVATVDPTDTATSGVVACTALGTDGVTVLTSNQVSFTITPATAPPPTEPTLVASQVG
jgi:hypothetical protein